MSDTASTPALPTCGKMVIELIDNGTSRPTPRVTFDPPGRFTPGFMFDNLPHFAQEIERAQAQVRHAATRAAVATPTTPTARRRR